MGAWKWLVRQTVPVLLVWPGGSWGFGVLCGLVSVAGGIGVLWFFGTEPGSLRLRRSERSAGLPVCVVVVAYGPSPYMLSALPGRHCPSGESQWRYIPGTGSTFLAYVVTVALVGWTLWRVLSARAELQVVRGSGRG
ncbi:hypothetical protein [Streptomyces sp. NPDC093544]|uniref:hypothetical protein n=1 Tax=Streptomyces sp. NPDC093544 TaxID=3155200 RepID=UPI003415D7C7